MNDLWQYWLWSFQAGGIKLEIFLHTQKKLLNFELMGRCQTLGIILENRVIKKLMLSKNVNNKKCAPELIFFNEKKTVKDSNNF